MEKHFVQDPALVTEKIARMQFIGWKIRHKIVDTTNTTVGTRNQLSLYDTPTQQHYVNKHFAQILMIIAVKYRCNVDDIEKNDEKNDDPRFGHKRLVSSGADYTGQQSFFGS